MSKHTPDKPNSEEERGSDEEEEEDKYLSHHVSPTAELQEYSYHESFEPGSSHTGQSSPGGLDLPTGGLRTRGPGRPRIHPLKPVGISRPRGRPKGSRNKKPRKRLEKPPKRPRGRPRKWPPEMWEGFQRARQTVVQQHMKQQQPMHHQQEMPGSSHMFMEQAESSMGGMQTMSSGMLPMQHPLHHPPHHHPPPHYMQFPLDPDQPQDLPLAMQHHPSPAELAQQQMTSHTLAMPGTEEQQHEALADPEELLWMQQLHPDQHHPPSTSR